jgi:hypothetical protein
MGASRFFWGSEFFRARGRFARCNSKLYCSECKERQRFGGLLHR